MKLPLLSLLAVLLVGCAKPCSPDAVVLSNDKMILEIKKCHEANMNADVWYWQCGGNPPSSVVCSWNY